MTDQEMRSIAERVDDLCGTPAVRRRWVKRAEELFRHDACAFRARFLSVSERIRSTEHSFVVDLCYGMLLSLRDAALPGAPLTHSSSRAVLGAVAWGGGPMYEDDARLALSIVEEDLCRSGLLSADTRTRPVPSEPDGTTSQSQDEVGYVARAQPELGGLERVRSVTFTQASEAIQKLIAAIQEQIARFGTTEPVATDDDQELRAYKDGYHPLYRRMNAAEDWLPCLRKFMGEEWVSSAIDSVHLCWGMYKEKAATRLPRAIKELNRLVHDLREYDFERMDPLILEFFSLQSQLAQLHPETQRRVKNLGLSDHSLFEAEMAPIWTQADDIRSRHHRLPALPLRPAKPVEGILPLREWCRTCITFRRAELERDSTPANKPRKATISKSEAEVKARQMLKDDPSFRDKQAREWAFAIGCSIGLVAKLGPWRAIQESKEKAGSAKAVSQTPAVLARAKSHDLASPLDQVANQETLKRLTEEQAKDQRSQRIRKQL